MSEYQKLENPQLLHLENENGFIIATKIDMSNINNKIVLFRGKYYNYDDGEMTGGNSAEVQYSLSEDVFFQLDKDNNPID
ncbi:hypothetical protein JK635_02165 [Neobacillus sp. YIM B02564]|uniref:Uncharacterized protein n=1 Tax=Neobacillus paridis TaxID=2803862 RepID=A0ABS1TJW6_9BACI|nr:hypothetical protein [Neobacillus paridis]MBL4951044.1 hypothetical protein [Neobacillus paridis]